MKRDCGKGNVEKEGHWKGRVERGGAWKRKDMEKKIFGKVKIRNVKIQAMKNMEMEVIVTRYFFFLLFSTFKNC